MGVVALSGGDLALIVLAAFWGLLVLFLAVVMLNLFRLLESVKMLVDGIRQETVPLLGEVRTSVTSVNKELERVDTVMQSAAKMSKSAERIASVVEQAVSSPLIKAIAFSAGASRALRRFRGERKDDGK